MPLHLLHRKDGHIIPCTARKRKFSIRLSKAPDSLCSPVVAVVFQLCVVISSKYSEQLKHTATIRPATCNFFSLRAAKKSAVLCCSFTFVHRVRELRFRISESFVEKSRREEYKGGGKRMGEPRDKPSGKELNAHKESERSPQSEIFCYAIAFIIDVFGIYVVDMLRDLCPWVYFRPSTHTGVRAIVTTLCTCTHTWFIYRKIRTRDECAPEFQIRAAFYDSYK